MALVEAVRGRFDIPQRWYTLKAKLLGLDRLADYDRSAPVLPEDVTFSYAESRELVLDTYDAFSPEAGARGAPLLRRAVGRRAGAPPQARRRLLRLHRAQRAPVRAAQLHRPAPRRAHHGPRARPRTARRAGPAPGRVSPVHPADAGRDRLGVRRGAGVRAHAGGGARRRRPPQPAGRADRRRHRHRVPPDGDEPLRAPGPHPPAQRGRAVGRPHLRVLGGSPGRAVRRVGRDHRRLSHVVVLHPALHQHPGVRLRLRLRPAAGAVGVRALPAGGDAFAPDYLKLLAAGGSRTPEELGAMVGIDLADPGFWDAGLALVEQQLRDAEELASRAEAGGLAVNGGLWGRVRSASWRAGCASAPLGARRRWRSA